MFLWWPRPQSRTGANLGNGGSGRAGNSGRTWLLPLSWVSQRAGGCTSMVTAPPARPQSRTGGSCGLRMRPPQTRGQQRISPRRLRLTIRAKTSGSGSRSSGSGRTRPHLSWLTPRTAGRTGTIMIVLLAALAGTSKSASPNMTWPTRRTWTSPPSTRMTCPPPSAMTMGMSLTSRTIPRLRR